MISTTALQQQQQQQQRVAWCRSRLHRPKTSSQCKQCHWCCGCWTRRTTWIVFWRPAQAFDFPCCRWWRCFAFWFRLLLLLFGSNCSCSFRLGSVVVVGCNLRQRFLFRNDTNTAILFVLFTIIASCIAVVADINGARTTAVIPAESKLMGATSRFRRRHGGFRRSHPGRKDVVSSQCASRRRRRRSSTTGSSQNISRSRKGSIVVVVRSSCCIRMYSYDSSPISVRSLQRPPWAPHPASFPTP